MTDAMVPDLLFDEAPDLTDTPRDPQTLLDAVNNPQIPDHAILKNTTLGEVRATLDATRPSGDVPTHESPYVPEGKVYIVTPSGDEALRAALHDGVERALTVGPNGSTGDPFSRRERVHSAIDAALDATRPTGDEALREAINRIVKGVGCVRMHWGARFPCDDPVYKGERDLCSVCAARILATPSSAPDEKEYARGYTVRWAFLDQETGDWIEFVPGTVALATPSSAPDVEIPDGLMVLEPRDLFDRAFRGVVHQGGVRYAMYSRKATIEALILYDGLDPTDAVEHYGFNVSGSIGVGFPVFLEDDEES